MSNPYQVLGISPQATAREIRQAYRERARSHHPDLGGDPQRMVEINAAYELLRDRSTPPPLPSNLTLSEWGELYIGWHQIAMQRNYKPGWIFHKLLESRPPLEIWQLHGQYMGYGKGWAWHKWQEQEQSTK
jgi:hypothetical protein